MRIRIIAVAALLALAAATATGCTTFNATSGPAPDTVTAVGNGTGAAAPDTAEFAFGATAQGRTNTAAMDAAAKAANAIVGALKAAGLDAKEIRTDRISLFTQTDGANAITGYQANVTVRVKTKKIDKAGDLTAAATSAGATDISGPDLSLGDQNAARIAAIGNAMADAKARAEAMAKAAGRSLGRVVSVVENGSNQPGPLYGAKAASADVTAVDIQPGQVETSVQVTVVYALE